MARPNFIELPARDLAAATTFFESLFGMTMTDSVRPTPARSRATAIPGRRQAMRERHDFSTGRRHLRWRRPDGGAA